MLSTLNCAQPPREGPSLKLLKKRARDPVHQIELGEHNRKKIKVLPKKPSEQCDATIETNPIHVKTSPYEQQNQYLLSLLKQPEETALSRKGHPPNPQNMVFTVSMGKDFSQRKISSAHLHTEYKPIKFAAVVCRIRDSNGSTTTLIFSTGNVVCVGGKTEEEVVTHSQKYRRMLQLCGYRTDFSDLTLHNLVCNANVGHPIDIAAFSESDPNNTVYNPELFPGAIRIVRLRNGKTIVFLIFDTGNIICMGLRKLTEAEEAMGIMIPILAMFASDFDSINAKKKSRTKKAPPQPKKKTRGDNQKTSTTSEGPTIHATFMTPEEATQTTPKSKALLSVKSLMSYIKCAAQKDIPDIFAAISKGDIAYLESYKLTSGKTVVDDEEAAEKTMDVIESELEDI